MKLEEGMYVRTDKGLIGKVTKKEQHDTHCILEYTGQYCKRVLSTSGNDSEVIKSSYNIIDLIEVGDYVNGEKVIDVGYLTNGPREGTKVVDYYIAPNTLYYFTNEDINSIVTKEQMEAMEYEVK